MTYNVTRNPNRAPMRNRWNLPYTPLECRSAAPRGLTMPTDRSGRICTASPLAILYLLAKESVQPNAPLRFFPVITFGKTRWRWLVLPLVPTDLHIVNWVVQRVQAFPYQTNRGWHQFQSGMHRPPSGDILTIENTTLTLAAVVFTYAQSHRGLVLCAVLQQYTAALSVIHWYGHCPPLTPLPVLTIPEVQALSRAVLQEWKVRLPVVTYGSGFFLGIQTAVCEALQTQESSLTRCMVGERLVPHRNPEATQKHTIPRSMIPPSTSLPERRRCRTAFVRIKCESRETECGEETCFLKKKRPHGEKQK